MTKKYATATAFRTGLEERLRTLSKKSGEGIQKLRRKVAFDRLLCRLFKKHRGNLFLKGGYSMELRMELARTTKDIDLVIRAATVKNTDTHEEIFEALQKAARDNLNDFFDFRIGAATLDLEAVPYGGYRFPIEAHLDGRLFIRFPMDIVVSSMVLEPIEEIASEDWLQFAGVGTMDFPAISAEQQFAEKLHAYTLPREDGENSRVKDLIDLLLLIRMEKLRIELLEKAIGEIFKYRGTHSLPSGLMEPPSNWLERFDKLRRECGLEINMDDCVAQVAAHLNLPVYVGEEKTATVPEKSKCHFCLNPATAWYSIMPNYQGAISENQLMMDFDCQKCSSYRVTRSFTEFNNADHNSDYWKRWAHYLYNRSDKEKRILITTKTALPSI